LKLILQFLIFSAMVLGTVTTAAFASPFVQAQINQQGDTVHLEFEGLPQWDYDIKKSEIKGKTFVQITLPQLNEKSLRLVQSFSNAMVRSIQVDENGPDGKNILNFEMASKAIEPFDYLTEKPSRLIVDFYKGQGSEKIEEAPNKKKAPSVKATAKSAKAEATALPEKKKGNREPANTDVLVINDQGQPINLSEALESKKPATGSIFDGGDPNYDRFSIKDYEIKEDSIISSRERVYLDFPMLRMKSPYLELLESRKPVYSIAPQDNDENKQARLLLTLFENKRYGVFQKTVDWFLQKYPESQYDEMVRFMWADSLFAIWTESHQADDFDVAMLRYRQAIEKYPQSALLERTMMLMGFATLDRGDYLGTLRLFQTHLQKRPTSPNKDIARFAIADAYLKINRYDEATQIYNEIEKDGSEEKNRIQAVFLRGDVAYQKKDFRTAIADYQTALKKYPNAEIDFPSAVYNQAAAYFGLQEYRKSLETYREFLKRFPSHPEAGFAMTRAGELLDILGADKTRVLGTYLETYFRYGDTPSSVVARLRMLSERMNTMKPKEVEKAVKDIGALSKNLDLPKMDQFATLMIASGFNRRKEFEKSIDLLMKFYQTHPTTVDANLVSNQIVKNINEKLKDLVEQGKFLEALQWQDQYADNWLKSSDRIDTKYNVGRAYEQAGVTKQALKLYQDTLNQIYALKGTTKGKERNIFEKLPTEDQVNLRIASIQAHDAQYSQAYEALKNIKNPQAMNERDQIERVQLSAQLLDRRGETDSAIRYLNELLKTWSGIPELVADPYLHLAQLEIKQNHPEEAMRSLKKISVLMEDSKKVSPQTHARSLEMLGELQLQKGLKDEAAQTYEQLLSLYENSKPLASYRYKVGQLYFEKGEVQKAAQVWNELKGSKNDLWYKLAQEQLKGSEWKNEYNKYIKRIPAMSDNKAPTERK
jgi:tetratricopeptide (TPR) repeat protein